MICPKCGSEVKEGNAFCTKCGAALNANANPAAEQGMSQQGANPQMGGAAYGNPNPQMGGMPYGNPNPQMGMPQQPYVDPKDHTGEFEAQDISNNKVLAMSAYLLGVVGVIIALLASRESAYVAFHVRQALKISICTTLVGLITAVLCWTVIVPIAGAICSVILLVVRIISFVQVCKGQAKEPAIIGSFGFLK